MRRTLLALSLAVLAAGLGCVSRPCCPPVEARGPTKGAVATVDPRATEAGMAALRAGGNAVDAAVTAALTLGVVDSHNSGIGGGCFLLARLAGGKILCIDGREKAPHAATRDMYVEDGKVVPGSSVKGPLAVGVPGSLAAYERALSRAGRRSLSDALAPGIRLAEEGAAVSPNVAERFKAKAEDLATFPATRAIFLDADGEPWPEGHRLVQKDLAGTYRKIAREGSRWLYKGGFAFALDKWMRKNGGILKYRDFASYYVRNRKPIRTRYRGYEIIGFPPPSSGGVHVGQILTMLNRYAVGRIDREDPSRRLHIMAEVMKRAFADRAHWLGDPDYVKVPRGLCAKEYCDRLGTTIDTDKATPVAGHGTPPHSADDVFGKHTTHIAAADAEGNWVAITTTINTAFGSKVVIPGTGVLLNNQMDDFSSLPGVPNAYGLVGAEANAIERGKRPLSSMSPTIVLKRGKPVFTVGGAGGPTIITQVVQAIVNHIDLDMDLPAAVAAPRIHHQWKPDVLHLEAGVPEDVVGSLRRRGHETRRRASMGVTQAIGLQPDGTFVSVVDPRVPRAR